IYSRGISLRSEKVNVAGIARALGGGGHTYSAGAPIDNADVDSIIEVISRYLEPLKPSQISQ
ncbi:MAG TPA: phosphohydrolase, partial [Desulfurococcaceae archaeon]|nr:phosphohydrolase [Desulfurococcaceae archaeon]